MVVRLKKAVLPAALTVALAAALCSLAFKITALSNRPTALMGGHVHPAVTPQTDTDQMTQAGDDAYFIRFQRPSSQQPLKNDYSFKDFDKDRSGKPLSLDGFQSPEDVILAYFGILCEAANMADYAGGCGTIGWAKLPYPYAYGLLSKDLQKRMPLTRFEDSFKGVGHLTLLKLYPAYAPPGTPDGTRYYMIEVELITGPEAGAPAGYRAGSHFAYFYGIVTTQKDDKNGWKISAIDYFPEDFLCAPYHGWDYDAKYLVPIIYQERYRLIDKTEKVDENGNTISVYASGGGKQYRFDFVRLTNGEDILLHEMVMENGKWAETNLLKGQDQVYKLSVLNPNLKKP